MFIASIIVCVVASKACMSIESPKPHFSLEECWLTAQELGNSLLSEGLFEDGTQLELRGVCTEYAVPERAA